MKTISFKVSEDEARKIRFRAKQAQLTVSEYLRRAANGSGETGAVGKVRCEFTGAEIFAPLADDQPFTTATVREMLNDFP